MAGENECEKEVEGIHCCCSCLTSDYSHVYRHSQGVLVLLIHFGGSVRTTIESDAFSGRAFEPIVRLLAFT